MTSTSTSVTGDIRVDHNLHALSAAIVESPLITNFIETIDTLNKRIHLKASVSDGSGERIAKPETFKALLLLSELDTIRRIYLTDKEEMLQEFSSLQGDRLQHVLHQMFSPMGNNQTMGDVPPLPPMIEMWVRPDVYASKIKAVEEAIEKGYLVKNEGY